jgi:hypothetical protein
MYQAVFRALGAAAAKGNGPALRLFFGLAHSSEREAAAQAIARETAQPEPEKMSELELARWIAFALELGARELEQQETRAPRIDTEDEPDDTDGRSETEDEAE